eukprot:11195606-Lingulodinium_polyedra.AAC.1
MDAITRAGLCRDIRFQALATMRAMSDQLFASATDWNVELFGGIHLRYVCAHCRAMPMRSCDFWRLTAER